MSEAGEQPRKRHTMTEQYDGHEGFPMHTTQEELPPTDSPDGQKASSWRNLGKDKPNVMILIFLYVLQGIPLGLAGSMPMILQARKADYHTQAFFSFAFWPFSVKLLWAPIVDSVYSERFGRRKSWLVPVQYLIGAFLFVLSYNITHLLGAEGTEIDVIALTATFICLCFLAATQDIAVDGWALTMLARENIGWASTCNTVGQTAGYFLGNVVFLALESAEFCNNYLRVDPQENGLVTIEGFMYFWAWVFLISTTLTMFLKKEEPEDDDQPDGIVDAYKMLWRIVKLRPVMKYCAILLTAKIAFAATDAIAGLKLISAGVPKEKLALLGVPMVPIQILLPLYISRYTSGPKPLSIYMKAYPLRILMGLVFAAVVWYTPHVRIGDSQFPVSYYGFLLFLYALHQVTLYCCFVAQMAFTAKVSDPAVGGTYMTLLNTLSNLGGNWPATVALYMVDHLTVKEKQPNGESVTTLDGFYVETLLCTVIGFAWWAWHKQRVNNLQSLPASSWKVT